MLVGAHHHRSGSIEDHPERNPTRALKREEQRPDQRLHPLVRDYDHLRPAGVLEPVGRKVDPLRSSFGKPDVHFTEVELGELARHPLEVHHELLRDRPPDLAVDPVEGTLPHLHPFFSELPKHLQPGGLRVFLHQGPHPPRDLRPDLRTAHSPLPPGYRVVGTEAIFDKFTTPTPLQQTAFKLPDVSFQM